MKPTDKKAQFRKIALKLLNKKRINNYKIDKILIKELISFIKKNKFKNIMIFISLKSEVNTTPLIKLLRQNRYNIFVPFIEGESFKLVQFRLPLKIKKFGIKEPNFSRKRVKNIDLAIVPLLGIDKNYKRIGFGKGMFDRFYSKNGKNIKNTLFLVRQLCYTDKVITDKFDISANYILTYKFKKIDIN